MKNLMSGSVLRRGSPRVKSLHAWGYAPSGAFILERGSIAAVFEAA